MESYGAMLLSIIHTIVQFFRTLAAAIFTPTDYSVQMYYPTAPAYFQAKKRAPEDVVTTRLTEENRKKHSQGFIGEEYEEGYAPFEKPDEEQQKRPTETVSVRSFLESRCPSLLKGAYPPISSTGL